MTDDRHSTRKGGPTVILIGGRMTVDDGSTLDSRQPIVGDPGSQVTRRSLATSLLWWTTVSSLVSRILDTAGQGTFALVIGGRSVVEVRGDGELRRTRLRSMLPGGSTTADFIRCVGWRLPHGYEAATEGTGYRLTHAGQRWVFVNHGEYYLHLAAAQVRPAAIVDTSWPFELEGEGASYEPYAGRFREFEKNRLFGDRIVLVMPHTHRTESFLRGYLTWARGGRPDDDSSRWAPPSPSPWDPAAPPDPIRYSCPVPVQADFGVTGLIQDGEWLDAADLEAARSLLQARFDLKIGIWDLVENSTLRRTLLESGPPNLVPVGAATIPSGAAETGQFAGRGEDEREGG